MTVGEDGVRIAVVVGVLLLVPLIVVLLTSGSSTIVRPQPRADVPSPSAGPPTLAVAPASTPAPVDVDPTELPAVGGCEPTAAMDRDGRRQAFRDGLAAEREGGGLSAEAEAWLAGLSEQLDTCMGRLTAEHAALRTEVRRTLDAVRAYEAAVAAPEKNSVTAAWGDLEDALEATIDAWASATK